MDHIIKEDITEKSISRNKIYKRLKNGRVLIFRRSFLDCLPWWALLVLSIVSLIWIFIELPQVSASLPYALFIPLAIFAVIIHKKYNVRYALSDKGISVKIGLLSLKLHELQIAYTKMRAVEVKRDLFQRIFDLGDLGVSTILIDNSEVLLVGVRRPSEITAVMEYYISLQIKKPDKDIINTDIAAPNYGSPSMIVH